MMNSLKEWGSEHAGLVRVGVGVLLALIVIGVLSPRGFVIAVVVLFIGVVLLLILFALPFALLGGVIERLKRRRTEVPSDE